MTHTGKVHKYWNQWYSIIEEDAPELLDEFIMDTAKRYGVSRSYVEREFICLLYTSDAADE